MGSLNYESRRQCIIWKVIHKAQQSRNHFLGYEVTASFSPLGDEMQFCFVFLLKAGMDDGCSAGNNYGWFN